jgi:hypothetical protein
LITQLEAMLYCKRMLLFPEHAALVATLVVSAAQAPVAQFWLTGGV